MRFGQVVWVLVMVNFRWLYFILIYRSHSKSSSPTEQFDSGCYIYDEKYAIKFCLNLEKMPQKRMECFRLLLEHLAWIEHQFLSSVRDSRKAGSLRGLMRDVGGVRKSIHQSWLAKQLRLGLLCWGFKGVQEEIPREEACTLQIGLVAFPAGQCTSPQLHPCHRLFDQDWQQDSSSASLWLLVIP